MRQRLAGVLLPVFALRHEDDLGVGDTRAVNDAIATLSRLGIGILQLLPINETGGDNSPYNAISSVAIDPTTIYLAPEVVPGLRQPAFDRLVTPELKASLQEGPVNYPKVKSLKEELLSVAFSEFEQTDLANNSEAARDFAAFEKTHDTWLSSYTLFRTLMKEHQGNACWPSWEPELQTVDGAAAWLSASPDRGRLERHRRFCSFVQWVAFRQWDKVRAHADRLGVGLMGDVPFGVSRYGADVWAERELFDLEWSGGAPPEVFFQGDPFTARWGQNWGIPLYDWDANRKENFQWWRRRVARVGDFFHYFRIDHVLGFFRVYAFPWIPERNGEFVDLTEEEAAELTGGLLPRFVENPDEPEEFALENAAQGEEILRVILDAAGETHVVAEDLGVVPDYVRPLLTDLDIPGFYIPHFERIEETREFKPKEEIPECTLGTYATHDHLPISAYYEELVKEWLGPEGHRGWLEVTRLMRFLGLDEHDPPRSYTDDLHRRLLEVLLQSPSRLAVLMVTDVLATAQRFNAPGSATDSNWSQRLDRTLDAYLADPVFGARMRLLAELVRASDRVPAKLTLSGSA